MSDKPKFLTVREFFNPTNKKHLRAYQERMATGHWPKKFFPKNVKQCEGAEHLDVLGVRTKIVAYWIDGIMNPEKTS